MKEVTTKITCDGCSSDISPKVTSYPAEYILKISAVNKAQHKEGMAIYSILILPPIDNDLYFCGFECISNYIKSRASK